MKKFAVGAALLVIILSLSCVEDTPEKIYRDFIKSTEKLISDIEKADAKSDSQAIADALEKYHDKLKSLAPRIKKVSEEYKKNPEKFDESMKNLMKEFDDVMKKALEAFAKLWKYLTSPEVQETLKELQKDIAELFK